MTTNMGHLRPLRPTPTYDALRIRIAELGDQFTSADIEHLLACVREISEPTHMLRLLREIMKSNNILQEVAQRSYRHVSHFDKIVLVEAGIPNGFRLTMHLWSPPYSISELSDELIHDHRFSFWSSILVGTLQSRNFFPNDRGTRYHHYSYKPERASTENLYAFNGVRKLKASKIIVETAGNAYFLDYRTTHKVLLPRRAMVCTLVLRSPRSRTHSNVYNTTYPQTDTSVSNIMFNDVELFSRLARLYSAIDAFRLERPAARPHRLEPEGASL